VKTCTKCNVVKPSNQFAFRKKSSDSLSPWCNACKKASAAAVRQRHIDAGRCAKGCESPRVSELYCQHHIDQMAKHRKARAARNLCRATIKCVNPPVAGLRYCEFHRDQARWDRLKYNFDLSRDGYEQMLAAQNGKCPITGEELTRFDDPNAPKLSIATVDHCHTSGEVRELLSSRANLVLGLLNEDPDLIQRVLVNMLAYLEKWKALKAA